MDTPGPSIYLALVLLVACSAFFSASETAISSFNKIRMRNKADDGDKRAKTALKVAEDFDKTISTILIGNNIVNMASASLATVAATALWGPTSGPAIATFGMTLIVLIFGEILPKSLAKDSAEFLAMQVSGIIAFLRTVFSPIVMFFVLLKRLFTGRRSAGLELQPSVTEDELKTIIDTVEEEGVLDSQETEIIQSAIEFDDITVQEILVPRVDMVAVDVNDPAAEVVNTVLENSYTRIPVYEGDIDHIIGMLHTRDLFECMARGQSIDVRALCRQIPFVYRTKHINDLLAEFRRQKQHMAIVTDDYGGTLGLVTLEDVLEELVGEIFDETDEVEELPVRQLEEHLFRVAGEANIDDVFEELGVRIKGFDSDFSSAAGWALECLEHIPAPGESFDFENLHVTVEQVEDKRILSLLVRLMPPEAQEK
ncbi:MAG TPA: hemolysin family protein [Candidatus Fournierella merdigallinarum]|nr:hemolysin family protein [Candidatus Fournierella merdigallinarum]